MSKNNLISKHIKRIVALTLMLSVMFSIFVPVNVFAEEEATPNNEIYAILYYVNPDYRTSDGLNINNNKNLELVFQRGNALDSNKTVVKDKNGNTGIFSIANDATTYTSNNAPITPWSAFNSTSSNQNIVKVDFKNRIKPASIEGWFRNCTNLKYEDISHKENLDTSECTKMTYTFSKCNQFTKFDFSEWTNMDFSAVTKMNYMFSDCSGLLNIDLTGVDPVNCTTCQAMFCNCPKLLYVKFGSFKAGNNNKPSSGTKGVSLASMFAKCSSLESFDMSEIELDYPNSTSNMFEYCSSLTKADLSRMYANTPLEGFSTAMKSMFRQCTSLEVLNLNGFPHTLGYTTIEVMLSGCVSLREFYLEDAKKVDNKYNANLFRDTNNLSYVAINENWKSINWVPAKETWTKVKMAKKPVTNEVPVGTELSNIELFNTSNATKRPTYAGTWTAETDFAFNANGGKVVIDNEDVEVQFINGKKGVALNYSNDIQNPVKEGYSFAGWHKDRTDNTPFASGDVADQWTYYAHWTDNTYKLILNANGGYIPNSSDTRIEYNNIKYSELQKLNKDAFVNDDGKVLVGWNTAADGSGESFAADDSVSMLTSTNGGEVTLYAMWYLPKATVSFNSHGGSAVEDKQFDNLPDVMGILSDSQKTNYTFLGWFTEEEGGTKVDESSPVTGNCTLHAHWQKNPVVVFDAGDGYFGDDPTNKTISKVYKYNSHIGVTPTPENGSASFLGWFVGDSHIPITSEYEVLSDVVLTAHWGYIPKFDTDGGIITNMPEYTAQTSANYTITELPTLKKDDYIFKGWKHGNDWVYQAGNTFPAGGVTVNLSSNNVITAVWEQKPYCTITLDANGGTLKNGTINPIKVYKNKAIAALPTPTRAGYDFDGWYIGNEKQTIESTYTENQTLTAKWTIKNCTVTFDAGDGTMEDNNKTKTIDVASGKTIPSVPGANLYNAEGNVSRPFAGWYTQPNGQGTKLTADTVINSDITYYAYYNEDKQIDDTDGYSYYIQWNTPSDSRVSNLGDRLVYHPLNGADLSAGIKVVFQAGSKAVPSGALKIKIPKYLFKNWNGNPITTNNAAGNEDFSLDKTSDTDYYIFTNTAAIQSGGVTFTIDYTFSPLNVNGGYTDENGYYHDGYVNNNINVGIEVDMDVNGTPETNYTKHLATEVHTKVDTSVSKFRSNVFLTWNDKWGTVPADANDYFYVEWKLNSSHAYQNYSQNFYLMWDENTVNDNGTIVYADKYVSHGDVQGQWTDMQWNGSKAYTVVTKHRKDLAKPIGGDSWATVSNEAILNVKWRSGYIEQFRTNASTTAYIPKSGNGIYNFSKAVPSMTENESHYKHGGQELITNREAENMPKLPYELNYTETSNTDNPSWNEHTSRYTAKPRTITLVDGRPNDVVISANSGNWSTDSWENSTPLEDGDYYFDSLKITVSEFDATKLGDEWSNPYEHTIYNDYDTTQIWVRKMNSNIFTLHKELVITSEETTVALPQDTVGYKIIHESEFFTTNISVKTNLCLKPTAKLATIVNKDIANNNKTLIKNRAKLDVECDNNTRSYSSDNSIWPCTYILDLSSTKLFTKKSCASQSKVKIDEDNMSEVMPVLISGWGYNNSGNKKRFTNGEFYDLLPKNFSVDKDTVYVKPILENWTETDYKNKKISADKYDTEITSGTLSKSYYSVRFVNNWENSDRTMMIVKVDIPDNIFATGANVYFKMSSRFSSISANGTTQVNMAAFKDETENARPPESKVSKLADNAIDPYYKHCFVDIDGNQTAYASANTNCKIPPIHEYGIDSVVNTETTTSKHQTVGLNTNYSYYISYGSGMDVVTNDMVFYNVLEHRIDGLESEWEGEFKGVDVSSLREAVNATDSTAHCEPVVWYAVKTGDNAKTKDSFVFDALTEDDDYNLDENTFWTTTPPEDLSDVTAIAVDCRYDDKGNLFNMKSNSTLGFNINMLSKKEPDKNNIFTYNEAVLRATITDTNTRIDMRSQTDVLLHFNTPNFEKSAFPVSGTENNPTKVVRNSVMEYTLNVENPDAEVGMTNIVVTDSFNSSLVKINDNNIRVKLNDGEEVNISKSAYIDSYSIKSENGSYKFNATINTLDAGKTISIIIPVTVIGQKNNTIINEAQIATINDYPFNITSNKSYHVIDDPQVKILKVNSKDEPLAGATLKILNDNTNQTDAEIYNAQGNTVGQFVSTTQMLSYSIQPGKYILHEISTPDDSIYKKSADIKFRIDTDGYIYINGTKTDCIKMINETAYKVIFHENQPNHDDEIFKIYEPVDLDKNLKIPHFYDIPEWAGDEYVFAGWYTAPNGGTPVNFENNTYPKREIDNPDYHIYAHWIAVGTVNKDNNDPNIYGDVPIRGFGLTGVQIRKDDLYDENYETKTIGGMRYITSLSENLLNQINALSSRKVNTNEGDVDVEYGYVVSSEENINNFVKHYNVKDTSKYKLQYKGENVNGINTTSNDSAETDFRYITNMNCTKGTGQIKKDHKNFSNYRLYTLVVTYKNTSTEEQKAKRIDARSYIRYYDANGKLRVFYNDYKKNMMFGGCLCSFSQAYAGIFG